MEHCIGIDVSLKLPGVCVIDGKGVIVRETKVTSAPDELVEFPVGLDLPIVRIGLEAGPLSQWLHAGITQGGSTLFTGVIEKMDFRPPKAAARRSCGIVAV